MALGIVYARAVERAGGLPVVLPPLARPRDRAARRPAAAICLSGGPDLDPAAYGAEPHPDLGPVEPALDAFELAVARRADALGIPVLGICRGCQALNVARGGTLHQHLPDVTDGSVDHRQTASGRETTHTVGSSRARGWPRSSAPASSTSTRSTTRRSTGSAAACGPWRGRRTA